MPDGVVLLALAICVLTGFLVLILGLCSMAGRTSDALEAEEWREYVRSVREATK